MERRNRITTKGKRRTRGIGRGINLDEGGEGRRRVIGGEGERRGTDGEEK